MVKKQSEGCISGAQLLISQAEGRGHGGMFVLMGCTRGLRRSTIWCSREWAESPTGAGIKLPPSFAMTPLAVPGGTAVLQSSGRAGGPHSTVWHLGER